MATITYDAATIQAAVDKAFYAAVKAATDYKDTHGESWACGFAWVTVYDVRSNSKMGKALANVGFRKAYGGGLQLWNPSGLGVQSISVLEAGAEAYAEVLKQELGLEKVYAGSRMD